jgi:hypothetical protein
VRDIHMLRAIWRELETWLWWHGEPNGSSKEPAWKSFPSRARASSRPYRDTPKRRMVRVSAVCVEVSLDSC